MPSTININTSSDDCPQYISTVQHIIEGCINTIELEEFYIVKIDNWFGDKWIGFSYKFIGAAGLTDTDDLVVPPFKPSRVVSEDYFIKVGKKYERQNPQIPIHLNLEYMELNAKRKVRILFPNSALFWWSGNSLQNGRGSLMAYIPSQDKHLGWFIGYKFDSGWKTGILKGITQKELIHYHEQSQFHD